jgi:hypothetical protein
MMKASLLSLALLAGVSAQTTTVRPTTTTTTAAPIATTGFTTQTLPTSYVGGSYIQAQPQYIAAPQQQIVYAQPQYIQAAPQVINPAAQLTGPQYPQYKPWGGKACYLIDTTPPGSKVKGVIVENDLNGDLSCNTGAAAATITAAFANTADASAPTTITATTPTTIIVGLNGVIINAANCGKLLTTDVNAQSCLNNKFILKTGAATLAAFVPTQTLCTALSTKRSIALPATNANILEQKKIAKCKANVPAFTVSA